MLIKKDPQLQFEDIPFIEFIYDKNHVLIQLESTINWEYFLTVLGQFYSPDQGRPTKLLRAKIGTEIIKRLYKKSDREAVQPVKENMYAQRFCGLHPSRVSEYMNSKNGLSDFRTKIGKEGLSFIEEVLQAAASKRPLKRGNNLIIDTTCVPADIIFPADIRLLERCRQEVIRLIKKAKQFGIKLAYRTYNRTARKVFVRFSKLSKPKEKTIKKAHKQMIQFVKRNFKQLNDLRKKSTEQLREKVLTDPNVHGFLKQLKEVEKKIQIILHQQKQSYRGIKQIPERIVSFHKAHIRPIVRGKIPVPTEFGPKVLIALVKGFTYVIQTFRTNVSDSNLVLPSLRWFKTKFGHLPDKIFGDRGFYSRWRARFLKDISIHPNLQQRGKVIESSSTKQRRWIFRHRLPIECRISSGKRKFGWDRCRAKNPDHEESWIRLQAAAMNVHLVFSCRSP
jgi:hypothetical protein